MALAVVVTGAAVLLALAAACGADAAPADDDRSASAASQGTSTEGLADAPVSQYALLLADLSVPNMATDTRRTWALTAELYARTGAFKDEATGRKRLAEWGYREGYETAISPEGGAHALLNSAYVVHQEIHLFDDAEGATAAFRYFADKVRGNGISQPVKGVAVGDESLATRTVSGEIVGGATRVDQALHQVIFRRENVVAVILTVGAAPLTTIDAAAELSAKVDAKIQGSAPRLVPTPIPGRTTAAASGSEGR